MGLCPITKWHIIVIIWKLMVCLIYTPSALRLGCICQENHSCPFYKYIANVLVQAFPLYLRNLRIQLIRYIRFTVDVY